MIKATGVIHFLLILSTFIYIINSTASIIGQNSPLQSLEDVSSRKSCKACKKTVSSLNHLLKAHKEINDAFMIDHCVTINKNDSEGGECQNAYPISYGLIFELLEMITDEESICDVATQTCHERNAENEMIKNGKFPCSICNAIMTKFAQMMSKVLHKSRQIFQMYCQNNPDCDINTFIFWHFPGTFYGHMVEPSKFCADKFKCTKIEENGPINNNSADANH